MDTDGIQISKKIEFEQNIILQYKWGVLWTQLVFKFQRNWIQTKPVYNKNEGFKRHKLYSNS